MKSLWNQKEYNEFSKSDLDVRVYTSQLLGRDDSLVLHGGGNTSVKTQVKNIYKENEDILYVKGSGWDLATIKREGFAPVRMEALLKMATLSKLDDKKMVALQRSAMIDPNAPNPSVEAILHAIIPFKFVDHTHADAVVTVSNTPDGEKLINQIYGDQVIVIPYVMPGFILANEVYKRTRQMDWSKIHGMILLNHGIFTFDDDAKKSYEKMIKLVTVAEDYLKKNVKEKKVTLKSKSVDLMKLANIRRAVSHQRGLPILAAPDGSLNQWQFASRSDIKSVSQRGPLTPDHIIRTKRVPVIIGDDEQKDINKYAKDYQQYFEQYADKSHQCLDPAPRWGILPGFGTIAFGCTVKELRIISDIKQHTTKAITLAESLGGWKALSKKDLFEMEYWTLEQAKLSKRVNPLSMQGKIVIVTGAASGIGEACVGEFLANGAVVVAMDINAKVTKMYDHPHVLGLKVDVTNERSLSKAVDQVVLNFGGIDMVVSNAGTFPASEKIDELHEDTWKKSLEVNLTSHQLLLKHCVKYLALGINPSIVLIASKNVPAPGPGVAAYSVPKAGLTQLGRVAALELASSGIRVNMVHPNAVFDTGIWSKSVLEKRALHYGMTVDEYKKNNLLKLEVTSHDVAKMVVAMSGPVFGKTTGAQVPIDGGNERVI